MTSASMSFGRPTRVVFPQPSLGFATLKAALLSRLQAFDRQLRLAQSDEPRNAEELLALAQRIEATQPGFADDLRATAQRSLGLQTH